LVRIALALVLVALASMVGRQPVVDMHQKEVVVCMVCILLG
jgi:hypothetical protein